MVRSWKKLISFLANGCKSNRKGMQLELAYRNNRQYEWPVEMGIATREEVELATFDELEMFNYQADKKFELMQGMDPEE